MRAVVATFVVGVSVAHAQPVAEAVPDRNKPRTDNVCSNNPLDKRCPSAPIERDVHQRVPTKTPRAKLSEFLVPLAKKAEKKQDWAAAIPIYQALVAARGGASPEAKKLAQ